MILHSDVMCLMCISITFPVRIVDSAVNLHLNGDGLIYLLITLNFLMFDVSFDYITPSDDSYPLKFAFPPFMIDNLINLHSSQIYLIELVIALGVRIFSFRRIFTFRGRVLDSTANFH